MYRNAVMNIPSLITMPETAEYSFGKMAFMDWAQSYQTGLYDKYPNESFPIWDAYQVYLCILGTNGCTEGFLLKALELNPDMTFINKLVPLFLEQTRYGMDALLTYEGGWSGITPEVIKNKERMKPICDKIMELSEYSDDILEIFADIDK